MSKTDRALLGTDARRYMQLKKVIFKFYGGITQLRGYENNELDGPYLTIDDKTGEIIDWKIYDGKQKKAIKDFLVTKIQ